MFVSFVLFFQCLRHLSSSKWCRLDKTISRSCLVKAIFGKVEINWHYHMIKSLITAFPTDQCRSAAVYAIVAR